MNTATRREKIVEYLFESVQPVSATTLANEFGVSRQIIVGDIAVIRAANLDIISTNRGYVLSKEGRVTKTRVFKVDHDESRTAEELNIIVDYGGKVENVFIIHDIYGKLVGELGISNRNHVKKFMDSLSGNRPLSKLTNNVHYHTVVAESEADLDLIEEALDKSGILIKDVK